MTVRTPIRSEDAKIMSQIGKTFTKIGLLSLILALPRGFESELSYDEDTYTIKPAAWRTNPFYAKVMVSLNMILLDMIPSLLVIYHNAKIWITIKKRLELNIMENE